MDDYIYIIDKHGHPLVPTKRKRKIQKLLKNGMAHVVRHTPFTVQLLYNTDHVEQPLCSDPSIRHECTVDDIIRTGRIKICSENVSVNKQKGNSMRLYLFKRIVRENDKDIAPFKMHTIEAEEREKRYYLYSHDPSIEFEKYVGEVF